MTLPEIFVPFDRLVEIEILGQRQLVPENDSLLRCFSISGDGEYLVWRFLLEW